MAQHKANKPSHAFAEAIRIAPKLKSSEITTTEEQEQLLEAEMTRLLVAYCRRAPGASKILNPCGLLCDHCHDPDPLADLPLPGPCHLAN